MEIINKEKNFSRPFKKPVLTIGNFDGVHLGHQHIFRQVKEKAKQIGGETIVYTFDPHPLTILEPQRQLLLITSIAEKLRLMAAQGIDVVICAPFSKEFAKLMPEDFVKKILYEEIGIQYLFVGHDYTFGRDRRGNIALLKEMGGKLGFQVEVVGPVRVDGEVVSSTRIREFIQQGQMEEASKMLGRFYLLQGQVIPGHGRGSKKLGFPTANIKPDNSLLPKPGIYATWSFYEGKRYASVANLGWNPTFHDQEFSIEVHIINFHQDIYGKNLRVEFVKRLRDEVTFPGPEELIKQIERDILTAQKILGP